MDYQSQQHGPGAILMNGTRIVGLNPNYDIIPPNELLWVVHARARTHFSAGNWSDAVIGLKTSDFPSILGFGGGHLASVRLAESLDSKFGEHLVLTPCKVRSSRETRTYYFVGPREFVDCVDFDATTHYHAKRNDVRLPLGEPTFYGRVAYPPAFGHVNGSPMTFFLRCSAILELDSEFADVRLHEYRVSPAD